MSESSSGAVPRLLTVNERVVESPTGTSPKVNAPGEATKVGMSTLAVYGIDVVPTEVPTESAPLAAPGFVGVKVSSTCFGRAGRQHERQRLVAAHRGVARGRQRVIVRSACPVLLSVTVSDFGCPSLTSPNATGVGATLNAAGRSAVPVTGWRGRGLPDHRCRARWCC